MSESTISWEGIQDRRALVPQHVVFRGFAAETVLLNVQTGYYHGMDAVGGRFFEVLRESPTVVAAAAALAAEYEQPDEVIREDVVRFCEDLVERGLIELAE
jgi:hypothetical protein